MEEIEYLQNIIRNHNVYDSVVSLSIKLLLKEKVKLRSNQNLFRRWIVEEKRDWTLLESAVQALGESHDNMSILIKGFESKYPHVRRMSLIQALRIANSKEEAGYIASKLINDHSTEVINALIYLIYNEWKLTIEDINIDKKAPTEYCITYAKGYDESLPTLQADFVRHTFTRKYRVQSTEQVDFRMLLGSEYQYVTNFLWQAENSFLSNPSRYVSQLDLFHEELLYPILVDKLKIKNNRNELALVEYSNRIEMLAKNKPELNVFAGAIAACRRLRANPETHSRFHRELTYTKSITWQERNALKRKLCGGYQELVDWIGKGYV